MGTQSQSSTIASPNSLSELVRRGVAAFVVALVAIVAFVSVANLAGVAPTFEAYSPIIAARGAGIGAVGATLVYGVLARVSETPNRHFLAAAVLVYGLALVPVAFRAPGMPGATTLGVALLPVMHAMVAVPCVAFLTGRVSWP